MSDFCCKKCNSTDYVKSGFVRGHQRYLFHSCGCKLHEHAPRGKPEAMKSLAMTLYAMGNMSFCSITRLLHVSDVSVLRWVRAEALTVPEPDVSSEVLVLSLDEMWHFLKKSQISSGFGGPMTLFTGEPGPGFWVTGVMYPAKNCSKK